MYKAKISQPLKMDFITKSFIKIADFENQFDILTKEFMSRESVHELFKKVQGKYGLSSGNGFYIKFGQLSSCHTINIKSVYDSICSKISFRLSSVIDQKFRIAFMEWEQKPISDEYLQNVQYKVNSIMTERNELHELFNQDMKNVNNLKAKILEYESELRSLCKKLLKGTDTVKSTDLIEKQIIPIFDKIQTEIFTLIQYLTYMKCKLFWLNENRVNCAKILIGMN